MNDSLRPAAVEVVRRRAFSWDVVSRYPAGFDMSLNQPYMFRWAAVRRARRVATEAGRSQDVVVARFEPGQPS